MSANLRTLGSNGHIILFYAPPGSICCLTCELLACSRSSLAFSFSPAFWKSVCSKHFEWACLKSADWDILNDLPRFRCQSHPAPLWENLLPNYLLCLFQYVSFSLCSFSKTSIYFITHYQSGYYKQLFLISEFSNIAYLC